MTYLPGFLAGCKDPILTEMVWVPASHKTHHEAGCFSLHDGPVSYKKMPPGQVTFQLGKIETIADLLRMMFYGDPWRHPNEFQGLGGMYNTRYADLAQTAANVLDGGGKETGKLSSIYAVGWHEKAVYMAYRVDEAGDLWAAIVVQDWRYVVRVANVDVGTDLSASARHAALRLPTTNGTTVVYSNRELPDIGLPFRVVSALRNDESLVQFHPSVNR